MGYALRQATLHDRAALELLIARSARGLGVGDYAPTQIEAALHGTFGVDTQLIRDATYFVVESEGEIVACGGWSRRRTLFGGDHYAQRSAAELDATTEAAKIRAFFVDPAHARRGIATRILAQCEADARAYGFRRLELMATLPGRPFYAARGYVEGTPIHHTLAPGLEIEFVPMSKTLEDEHHGGA